MNNEGKTAKQIQLDHQGRGPNKVLRSVRVPKFKVNEDEIFATLVFTPPLRVTEEQFKVAFKQREDGVCILSWKVEP